MPRLPRLRRPASRCAIPSGLPSFHPAYLPPTLRRQIRRRFDRRGIFLNIPYSPDYTPLEMAIIATATAYGLNPVMAKQRAVFDVRFRRIIEMICSCAFGFTDLSFNTRMNMPLELGIMLALGKNSFIVSRRRYSALASVSDLSLGDVRYHEGNPYRLIADFSRWIEGNCSSKRLTLEQLIDRYEAFVDLRRALGRNDFDRLTPSQIAAMLRNARQAFRIGIVGRA